MRLMGGNRAALAAVYPSKLMSDVLQTFRTQLENDGPSRTATSQSCLQASGTMELSTATALRAAQKR